MGDGIIMNYLTGNELPSPRADPEIIREEDFNFVFRGKVPGFSGELDLKRRGSDRSPTAKATTMLILVAEACLAAVTIAAICKLVAASALLLAVAALATFAGVLIAGTVISFRRDGAAPSRPEVAPGHLTPNWDARPHVGNGTAQALTREAHQERLRDEERAQGQ
jgi:hypothetical protein